ncbi:phosphate acetyltransferase [Burkholderia sp. PU8-34]
MSESRQHQKYDALIARCRTLRPVTVAVAHPCDDVSLRAAVDAARAGIIVPVLVGPVERMTALAATLGIDLSGYRLVDAPHSHAAAALAVEQVRTGNADALMKGSLHTDELLAEVVRADTGIRTERRLSHVFIMDVPTYRKPLFITDAAVNIHPTLEQKADIAQNAIDLARALGVDRPKVAILSAVETVSSKLPSTLDAAALCKMAERGQITGATLDGPLALDNAISPEAARVKHLGSDVAGDADILLAPDLEAGNMLAKELTFLANADAAGIVLGARVPIILTSRADSERTRMASCAVAALYAHATRPTGARANAAQPVGQAVAQPVEQPVELAVEQPVEQAVAQPVVQPVTQ